MTVLELPTAHLHPGEIWTSPQFPLKPKIPGASSTNSVDSLTTSAVRSPVSPARNRPVRGDHLFNRAPAPGVAVEHQHRLWHVWLAKKHQKRSVSGRDSGAPSFSCSRDLVPALLCPLRPWLPGYSLSCYGSQTTACYLDLGSSDKSLKESLEKQQMGGLLWWSSGRIQLPTQGTWIQSLAPGSRTLQGNKAHATAREAHVLQGRPWVRN